MIQYISLAALVSAASVASVALDRKLQKKRQVAATAPTTEETAASPGMTAAFTATVTDSLRGGPKAWFNRLRGKKAAALPQQFLAWIDQAPTVEQPVADWLHGLSEPGLQAFTEHLAAFCADMGFELAWLVEQQFAHNPELTQAAEKIVLSYCWACQQAAVAQEDIEAHKMLQAFEQDPSSRKHQEFGQKLFAKLVQEGLTAANVSDYLAASAKTRPQQTLQAIQEAVKKDSPAFNRALKEVVKSLDGTLTVPQASPAAASEAPQPSSPAASEARQPGSAATGASVYEPPAYGAPA